MDVENCLFGLDGDDDVVNLVRRHSPDAAIAFNRTPADTVDAAARWLHEAGGQFSRPQHPD